MRKLLAQIKNNMVELKEDESGQVMAEYGLVIALIAVVCIAGLTAVGVSLLRKYNDVNDALQ